MRPFNNPFNTSVIESIPFVFLDKTNSLNSILKTFEENNFKGAICGPQGSGKTVLMDEIQLRLKANGWVVKKNVFYQEDSFVFKTKKILALCKNISKNEAVFIDGAEQLFYPLWMFAKWSISNSAAAFLITIHKPGRMPVIYQTRTCEKLLEKLLLEYPVEPIIDWNSFDLKQLFYKNNGNIREVFRALYDMTASIADK